MVLWILKYNLLFWSLSTKIKIQCRSIWIHLHSVSPYLLSALCVLLLHELIRAFNLIFVVASFFVFLPHRQFIEREKNKISKVILLFLILPQKITLNDWLNEHASVQFSVTCHRKMGRSDQGCQFKNCISSER